MASEQLKQVHTLTLDDFTSTKGKWLRHKIRGAPGILFKTTQIECTAEVDVDKNTTAATITLVVVKFKDNCGWESSQLSIGAKLGETGEYRFEDITKEFLDGPTDTDMHIARTFRFTGTGDDHTTATKIYLGLFDESETPKEGLMFKTAMVNY